GPSGEVTWRARRDSQQRLAAIELEGSGLPQVAASFEYDGATPKRFTRSNGMVTDVVYDQYGLLKSVFATLNGQFVDGYEVLERDSRLFVTKVAQPNFQGIGSRFEFDELGRTKSAKLGLLDLQQFEVPFPQARAATEVELEYFGSSQLRRERRTTDSSGTTVDTYGIDPTTGLYASFNGLPFTYDAADRVTRNPDGKGYGYNTLGEMTEIKDPSGSTLVAMEYDLFGRLFAVEDAATAERSTHRWLGSTRLITENRQGEKTVHVPYPGVADEDIAFYKESVGAVTGYYPTVDSNYSVSKVFTDGSSAVTEEYVYSFDGKATKRSAGGSGSVNNNEFLGMQSIGHDTSHVRARQYDQAMGIFLQRDPRQGAAGNVDAAQSFVSNNPINLRDPAGLQASADELSKLLGEYGHQISPQEILGMERKVESAQPLARDISVVIVATGENIASIPDRFRTAI
ncbi:MAG: hypothetical protein KDD70_18850, partial [Bdellovibrionales bacterium]|nr:hypothetical protein [Bdellovibrionales bacterium]